RWVAALSPHATRFCLATQRQQLIPARLVTPWAAPPAAGQARPSRAWAGDSSWAGLGRRGAGRARADALVSWGAWAAPAWPSRRVAGTAPRRGWSRRALSGRDRAHSRRRYATPVSPAWLGSHDRGRGG